MSTFYLSVWDYVVFGTVLTISALIGVYFRFTGGKQKTVEEYLLANGEMSATPVAFSLMASFISAITILGVSSEVYNFGTQFLIINFAHALGTPVVCYVFLPVFYGLRKCSIYEYLEERFGKTTRVFASITFIIQMTLYMGIALYAPSIALSAVTGLDKTIAILSVGSVCTFYSAIGGIKAVLFTDMFQSFLMLAAVISVIWQGLLEFDGVSHIWNIAVEGNRIEFFDFDIDPTHRHTFFTQLIGGTFVFLSLYAVNQAQVQRLLTTRNLKTARLSLLYHLPILTVLSLSTGFAGLVMYAKYRDCDPIQHGRIASADQMLPLFVVDSFKDIPGVTGLFISGILSGSLSTVSSAINSLAAVTFEDYIKPHITSENSPVSLLTKGLALIFGVACTVLAFFADKFTGVLQASLTVFGVVGGPLLGLFTCGMLLPSTSEVSVLPAFLLAFGFTSWMGFGGPKPIPERLAFGNECESSFSVLNSTIHAANNTIASDYDDYFYMYRISYQWYPLIGFTITVTIALILSLFFKKDKEIKAGLLSPIVGMIA